MHKMEGLVTDDPEVVSWMDRHPDQAPQVNPVSLKKDGSFTKNSSVASAEQLEQLGYMVNRRVQALADGWMSGEIPVNPYVMMKGSKKETACDYCSWTSRRLVFTNKSLSAILVNLERWYGVHFHSVGNIDLSAKLSFHIEYESLEEAMRLISRIAPIRYDIRGGTGFLAPE